MNDLQSLQELFRHMEWADSLVWSRVMANDHAATDAPLRDRLYHIHLVQRGFLLVWKGIAISPPSTSLPDTPSVLSWGRKYHVDVSGYLNNLTEQDLAREAKVPWAVMYESQLGRKAEVASLRETMLQVVMHSTHHRGQVCTKLKELGGEPPLIDLIVWVWSGKPEAVWPELTV
jgi:uncharacterized damage-inducible protein DinB